jgi:hypothetical protein
MSGDKTFTGKKLDWLRCVSFDRRLQKYPYDFKVAFQIAQHVNEKRGTAFVSDAVIADKAGGGTPRNVAKARKRLSEFGWITWRRTRTANVYTLDFAKVNDTLDTMTIWSDERRERRQKLANGKLRDINHSSDLKAPDMNHSADQVRNHSSDRHLRKDTSKQEGSQGEAGLRVEASGRYRPKLIAVSS